MFVDKVTVKVQAGNGGNGIVSFRHEKFVEKGGPDGGDGGNGGDVVFKASNNQDTLATFRYKKLLKAENGENGSKRRKHGKSGEDTIIEVPSGTLVTNVDGEILADLVNNGESAVVAMGGKGGFGNAHFTSSTRQAPRIAEKGEQGDRLEIILELKLIADIGLIGLPNAGKSTLLAQCSNARPEIADYPFTTLKPNLGVVDLNENTSLLIADIPGLIEGASQGKGLGDEFLRHIERTSILIHVIDIYNEDIAKVYQVITNELARFSDTLAVKPQIIALNKAEGLDEELKQHQLNQLKKVLPKTVKPLFISAVSGLGVKELLKTAFNLVQSERQKLLQEHEEELPIIRFVEPDTNWYVTKHEDEVVVTGGKIERFARRTDFSNPAGVQRLRDIMRKMGVIKEIEKKQIEPGTIIQIGEPKIGELEY